MGDKWDVVAKVDEKPKSQSVHEFFTEQLRRKFNLLPHAGKKIIREAHAAGLEWKGEDTQKKLIQLGGMSHFEHVFSEYKKMKEIGVCEYRKQALSLMQKYINRAP